MEVAGLCQLYGPFRFDAGLVGLLGKYVIKNVEQVIPLFTETNEQNLNFFLKKHHSQLQSHRFSGKMLTETILSIFKYEFINILLPEGNAEKF